MCALLDGLNFQSSQNPFLVRIFIELSEISNRNHRSELTERPFPITVEDIITQPTTDVPIVPLYLSYEVDFFREVRLLTPNHPCDFKVVRLVWVRFVSRLVYPVFLQVERSSMFVLYGNDPLLA
jgi:hypothetical protein